ncbi:MAG: leucine-rich repeat protein [Lachnospiraceae bacterium]|nr:leucine-rich repeat protein [Lachnospiraceae bacterium]
MRKKAAKRLFTLALALSVAVSGVSPNGIVKAEEAQEEIVAEMLSEEGSEETSEEVSEDISEDNSGESTQEEVTEAVTEAPEAEAFEGEAFEGESINAAPEESLSAEEAIVATSNYETYWPVGQKYGFDYQIDENGITILHLSYADPNNQSDHYAHKSIIEGEIVIPESITAKDGKTYKVTSLGESAFNYKTITTFAVDRTATANVPAPSAETQYFRTNPIFVTIPSSIQKIEAYCFNEEIKFMFYDKNEEDVNKRKLELPSSLVSVGNYAFYGCSLNDGHFVFPEGLKEIGNYAFFGMATMKGGLDIPGTVVSIGNYAFSGLGGISEEVVINNGSDALSIGEYAFNGLQAKSLAIKRTTISSIGKYAFNGMSRAVADESITTLFPENASVKVIDDYAFQGCRELGYALNLPKDLTYLGASAFQNCESFSIPVVSGAQKLVIPDAITELKDYTFCECSTMSGKLDLNNVTTIGRYTFYDCYYLYGDLDLSKVDKLGESAFELRFIRTKPGAVDEKEKDLTSTTMINELMENLSDGAATMIEDAYLTGFTGKLILSKKIDNIPAKCFAGQARLGGLQYSLEIPDTVKSIGASAFYTCPSFVGDLEIPDSVTVIGAGAFMNMRGINGKLTLPKDLKRIESNTFENDYNMKSTLVIPEGVSDIGYKAFSRCRSLYGSLEFPKELKTLGEAAFYRCRSFTGDLIFPDTVTNIGASCFYEAQGFDGDLKLPANPAFTRINEKVFYNVELIESKGTKLSDGEDKLMAEGWLNKPNEVADGGVVIPDNIMYIGDTAFYNCINIANIQMKGNVDTISDTAFDSTISSQMRMQYHTYKNDECPCYNFLKKEYPVDFEQRILYPLPEVSINVYKVTKNGDKEEKELLYEDKTYDIVAGTNIQLAVEATDENGESVDSPIAYTSEEPATLGVGANGVVSARLLESSKEVGALVKTRDGSGAKFRVNFKVYGTDELVSSFNIKDSLTAEAPATSISLKRTATGGETKKLYITDIEKGPVADEYKEAFEWIPSAEGIVKITPVDKLGKQIKITPIKTASTAYVTLTAKGVYSNNVRRSISVALTTENIYAAEVTVAEAIYTGKALTPKVTVKYNGKTLKKGTDYTVAYTNNVNIGYGTVTITGIGAYSGAKAMSFQIKPIQIQYRAYVQKKNWMNFVTEGIAGTTDDLRMETIQLRVKNKGTLSGGFQYRAYVQKMNWTHYADTAATTGDKTYAGTKGMSRRVEAIQIKAYGDVAKVYDVYYRAYSDNFGWLAWAKNGKPAGTAGYAYKLRAFDLKIVPKGSAAPYETSAHKAYEQKTK